MAAETLLALWNDTPTRRAIVDFVRAVSTEGSPGFVAPAERVAVFDNDGTLWSEKPVPIQLDFTLFRMADLGLLMGAVESAFEALRLLVLHDDADREFVVSMKEDWSAVFASA